MTDKIDLSSLETALVTLRDSLKRPPANLLERDGVIQRFEYTFELSWKMIRKVLLAMGRIDVSASPKPLLRDAHQEHFLEDIEKWFGFLEARNQTSHIYDSKIAEKVYRAAQEFAPYGEALLEKLRKTINALP